MISTPEERQNFRIAGTGCGIHWPDLDEDMGVEGLLLGKAFYRKPGVFREMVGSSSLGKVREDGWTTRREMVWE